MDPALIAASVISVLSPYLGKAAEKFAEGIGGAAWNKTTELYSFLKARLTGTPAAQAALTNMEKAPDDAGKQAALGTTLQKLLADDPDFLQQVATLVAAAGQAGGPVFNNQIAGDVGKIVNIGSAQDITIN